MAAATAHTRDRWTIGVSLGASLLLHMLVLVPMLHRSASGGPAAGSADLPELTVRPPDADHRPPQAEPGIEKSRAVTMSWIGHEAYEEHMAELAAVDQAAFTPDPALVEAGGAPPAEVATESEQASAAQGESGADESAEPTLVEAPVGAVVDATADTSAEEPGVAGFLDDAEGPDLAEQTERVLEVVLAIREAMGRFGAGQMPPEESENPDSDRAPGEATETPEREPSEAGGEGTTQGTSSGEGDADSEEAPPRDGEQREMESQATSTIDLRRDQLHPGRPIAREGLELFPRQPVFTTLTRMTALPRNPVVEIRFGPAGVPLGAEVLRSSGNKSVDDAVLASLFRWRARGAALMDLKDDATSDIRIRIVLNPYARE